MRARGGTNTLKKKGRTQSEILSLQKQMEKCRRGECEQQVKMLQREVKEITNFRKDTGLEQFQDNGWGRGRIPQGLLSK